MSVVLQRCRRHTGQSKERVFSVIIILGQCGQTKTRTQPIGLLGRINKPAFVFIIQMGLSTMYVHTYV